MKKLLVILSMAFISSCATGVDDYVDPPLSVTQFEGDLFEVVFRYAFDNNASALQKRADFYSLEIKRRDPENAFIKRFGDIKKRIYPSSETKFSCEKGVFTSEQDGKGLHFTIDGLSFESPTQVTVEWGYTEGCLSSALSNAKLEYINGVWVLLSSEIILISNFILNKKQNDYAFGLGSFEKHSMY